MAGPSVHLGFRNVSRDGIISDLEVVDEQNLILEVTVGGLEDDLLQGIAERPDEFVFSSRSRVARLGIEVEITSRFEVEGETIRFRARAFPIVSKFPTYDHLSDILLPNMQIGRLFHADPATQVGGDELYEAILKRQLILPDGFSLDAEGRVYLRSHSRVYEMREPLSRNDVVTILTVPEGRLRLDQLQRPVDVDRVILHPGKGLITSCSLFLKDHFMVLDTGQSLFGKHSKATVLDPLKTRGPRILLEIYNPNQSIVIDPLMRCNVYRAVPRKQVTKVYLSANERPCLSREDICQYEHLEQVFSRMLLHPPAQTDLTANKTAAAVSTAEDLEALLRDPTGYPHVANCGPFSLQETHGTARSVSFREFGSLKVIDDWDRQEPATLLLNYFPNNAEFLALAQDRRLERYRRIIFRNASFNHRHFLSSGDHLRLRTLQDLGVEVFWLNDMFREVSQHVLRDNIGYFMRPDVVGRFHRSLFFAFYGSGGVLSDETKERVKRLFGSLAQFFGGDIGVLTGGGAGIMGYANQCAHEMGLLSGASFLAIDEQPPNLDAIDFYQFFQANARHARQKWFELCQFQVFNVGGAGTLEEIGITLCNVKLGVIQPRPLVFFGSQTNGHRAPSYWSGLQEQIGIMLREERIPDWLTHNLLFSNDPEEVLRFYRECLEVS